MLPAGMKNNSKIKKLISPVCSNRKKELLNYYENNGYPFAEVSLENIAISGDKIKGDLTVKKGPFIILTASGFLEKQKLKIYFFNIISVSAMAVFTTIKN